MVEPLPGGRPRIRRHHDGLLHHVRLRVDEVLDHAESVDSRHHQVENERIESGRVELFDRMLSIRRLDRLKTGATQQAHDERANGVFIVGDEHARRLWFEHLVLISRRTRAAAVLLHRMHMERRSSYRALIVEDDGAILNLVKVVLERESFTVEGVRTAAAAIELLPSIAYDLLIVDLMLPEIGGEQLLGYLELTQPKYLRRVIVTTASPGRMSCEFLQRICRLLAKPFDIEELILIAKECARPEAA